MRYLLALSLSVSLAACSGNLISAFPGGGDAGTSTRADASRNNNYDASDHPCPTGQHWDGQACVINEYSCAPEFPCPAGMECVGGRCITLPGPCVTNNDCPTGYQCVNGDCQALCGSNPQCTLDSECGANSLCVNCLCVGIDQCAIPTADISGAAWNARQVLHISQALGGFGSGFAYVMKDLRDGIMGCPSGSRWDCFLFEIIAAFLPNWASTLFVAFGNVFDLIDNDAFTIDSQMTFVTNGSPSGYTGTDHWTLLSFQYQGQQVSKKPEDLPQIGHPVVVSFQSSTVCGVLYVEKHNVDGALGGMLKWVVDSVVEVTTCPWDPPFSLGACDPNANDCPCYKTVASAITNGLAQACLLIDNALAQAACNLLLNGLAGKLDSMLASWLLNYTVMTLQGTATVNPNGHALEQGQWTGTLGNSTKIFNNFTGEWSAAR